MKKIILSLLSLVFFIGATSCTIRINGNEKLKPSKTQVTKKYHVNEFQQIESNVPANIVFIQSNTNKVEAEGPENHIAHLVISTKDNALTIKLSDPKIRFRNSKNNPLIIRVSAPVLSALTQKGIGDIHLKGNIQSEVLTLSNKGVGDIKSDNLTCQELIVDIKGVGDIILHGETQKAQYYSKGVGDIMAKDMKAKEAKAELSGVGDIACFADERITAISKGVGDINIFGNPQEKELSKKGVGSIKEQ